MMSDLTTFLLARLDEDESVALSARKDAWDLNAPIETHEDPWPSHARFADSFTPARVLADVQAKRKMLLELDARREGAEGGWGLV